MPKPWFLLGALLLSSGCGGGGGGSEPPTIPPAPTPTPPTTVNAIDGWSDEPVTTLTATPGARVRVEADGYLSRTQRATPTIHLWPELMPRQALRDLVYTWADELHPLWRWREGFTVEGSDFRVPFVPAGPTVVRVEIDANDQHFRDNPRSIGYCSLWTSGAWITRAKVVVKGPRWNTPRVVRHELGHAAGLGHVGDPSFLMYQGGRNTNFTELERIALHMMYRHRDAGNELPDTEGTVAAAAERMYVIDCSPH